MALSKLILPSGSVLQVQHTQVTARSSTAAMGVNSTVDVPPMNVLITPAATSNKIKIEVSMIGEFTLQTTHNVMFWLKRTIGGVTTEIRAPADVSNNSRGIAISTLSLDANQSSSPEHLSFVYFDEPNTTSQTTYQLVCTNGSQNGTVWRINSTADTTTGQNYERGISVICATEIAG